MRLEFQTKTAGALSSSLATRFAAMAAVALLVVMAASGYVGARLEESALRAQLERQSAQLTELAAAEVANDIFTFALNDLDAKVAVFRKDPSVRFLEIKDKDGKPLKTAGAADDARLVSNTRDIVAGGAVIGSITLALATDSIDRAIARAWWLLLAREAAGVLVLSVALFVLIRRTVARPMSDVARIAADVANGDLTRRFALRGKDEIGRSGAAFNAVMERFHDIVAQVRTSAETVTAGAGQISTGNANLSQRTEAQASSLEETAATLEEFATTTKQNAQAAGKANEVAQSAAQISARGNAAVEKVVATMSEISATSGRIADITAVIDAIAFQTNILALNAAVEAARAGDHGRGFAVVATEVRALAHRSAAAAREIRGLIGSSEEKINAGSRVAQEAGKTISELVAAVEQVRIMVASIAEASREQSAGVQQINATVTQMESIVQQNATVVDQAAKAAISLKLQADELLAIVAGFHVARADTQPAGPAPFAEARDTLARVMPHTRAPREGPARPVPAARDLAEDWREF